MPKPIFDSDLACERRRADVKIAGIRWEKVKRKGITLEKITVCDEEGEKSIGRPIGRYDTLHSRRLDLLDGEEKESMVLCLVHELLSMMPKKTDRRILFVGVGNRDLTADAIGPRSADKITATRHVKNADPSLFEELGCDALAVFVPGVTAQTGMEASDIVKSICRMIRADTVIAVDSLAAGSVGRLCSCIQISDTGIFPGTGVKNAKKPMTKKTVGVPVIAVGVPTVTAAAVMIKEALSKRKKVANQAKKYDELFVSPKEIDEIVKTASEIISDAVNRAFGIEL